MESRGCRTWFVPPQPRNPWLCHGVIGSFFAFGLESQAHMAEQVSRIGAGIGVGM